jgi:primosomal protein N' (replication factor Y)
VPDLTPGQAEVAGRLVAAVGARRFATFLLDGVTGSGKTETYAEAIAAAMEQGRQVLVLLPEIALTQSFLARFEARFGTAPVTWHSSLKSSERRRAWRAVARGEAQVVVGARSALFLPFASLGLIVVDEAHEISFKQDDGVRYNARDVAVMRGHFERIPVVLASATPALESLHMASTGRYERLVLPSRFGGAGLPDIKILDLREHAPERGHWLAPPLVEGLRDRLAKGEQSLLFLNRRGYARSPCAAPAAIASSAPIARPGWWSIACRGGWPATIAAMKCPRPMPAPNAASPIAWSPAAPAWSGSPMKSPRSCPRRAWRLSLRTR